MQRFSAPPGLRKVLAYLPLLIAALYLLLAFLPFARAQAVDNGHMTVFSRSVYALPAAVIVQVVLYPALAAVIWLLTWRNKDFALLSRYVYLAISALQVGFLFWQLFVAQRVLRGELLLALYPGGNIVNVTAGVGFWLLLAATLPLMANGVLRCLGRGVPYFGERSGPEKSKTAESAAAARQDDSFQIP
ncbi:MAG: hypothetical protein LBJ11_00910 [Oscillospiraceae bacterium]|nr:hypothetical protein [Oscillospiraceae bacterium]